jgi:hypothetical protein
MPADTQSISIHVPRERALAFLVDPANLPRWAVGFAKSVRREREDWLVTTGSGDVKFRVESEPRSGSVDFVISPAPGLEALAASRVLPNGSGCEVVFTQFQQPGMSDDAFHQSVRAVAHELTVLKAVLEVNCPA